MPMTRPISLRLASAALCLTALAFPLALSAQVSLTTLGVAATQNFDTLPTTGSATWTNNSTVPGWFHARTGTGTTIVANNGSSNAGNLYSYGTGTATDRALGSLGSGNAAVGSLFWGIRLQNNTGATITSLDVSYTGEQWRNSAAAAQTVAFSYLVGAPTVTGSLAEFQSAGVTVTALDFTGPITGGVAAALDGNLAANRTAITASITGLSIPNGSEIMLRWSDPDHTGADHGLSIDDFSVTPQGAGVASADLVLTKSDSADPVNAGAALDYTISLTNNGPNPADSVTITDTVPAGVSITGFSTFPGWTCMAPGTTYTCTIASMPVGTASFTLNTLVDAATADGTVLSNTASASSTTTDPTPGDASDTETTTVGTSADLSVTVTDMPDPVQPGAALTYTINLSNAGPSDAAGATLTDTLPAGTTFGSLVTPAGWSCTTPAVGGTGTVNCSALANVPTGVAGDASFTLAVDVDPGAMPGTMISNTATVAATTSDPTPGNGSATATTTVGPGSAELVLSMGGPTSAASGGVANYSFAIQNDGPSTANAVELTTSVVPGTTFVSFVAPTGSWTCSTPAAGGTGPISCTSPSLAASANSGAFNLQVNISASTPDGTVLAQMASVTSTTPDPAPGNNSGVVNTTAGTSADLSVTKTAAPEPVTAGANLSYTITPSNAGPSNATNTVLSDTLPAGTTFVSLAAPGGWSCTAPAVGSTGTVSCSNASMAPGSEVFTLVAQVDATVGGGTVIANTATISSATPDPNPGSESATANSTVSAPAALSGTKTAAGNLVPGGSVTYSIVISNAAATAQGDNPGDEFIDVLPAGLTLVSASATSGTAIATIGSNTVTWNGSIAGNGSVTITIDASIDLDVIGGSTIINQGTINFDADGNGSNESSTTTDNPATGTALDGTPIVVLGTATPVPGVSDWSRLLLMLALTLGAGLALRRRMA